MNLEVKKKSSVRMSAAIEKVNGASAPWDFLILNFTRSLEP